MAYAADRALRNRQSINPLCATGHIAASFAGRSWIHSDLTQWFGDGQMSRASVRRFTLYTFETWSIQTHDLNIDMCRFLARHSALLGYGKDWLAQCHENVTEWDIRTWCWGPGPPVG